jgi:hydroxymethylpyrimidine/phosphomethylpyrimidine kinase
VSGPAAALPPSRPLPVCLSIAGSDSGGGAGIQADLKAFAAAGVHGTTAITAITAQNTVAVEAVEAVSPSMVVAQVRAVVEDLGVDAVKVGMLGSAVTTRAVADALDLLPVGTPVVVDPVMVAESGARLLEAEAQLALVALILPQATVVTPNLPEARVLAGDAAGAMTPAELAEAILLLGPGAVLVTGGHREEATDLLHDGRTLLELPGERHPDGAAHGSGCTHSSTLAAHLARGASLPDAARAARSAAAAAVRDGLRGLGRGAGPVDVLGIGRGAGPAGPVAPAAGRAAGRAGDAR